jgi:hypothetical protein
VNDAEDRKARFNSCFCFSTRNYKLFFRALAEMEIQPFHIGIRHFQQLQMSLHRLQQKGKIQRCSQRLENN